MLFNTANASQCTKCEDEVPLNLMNSCYAAEGQGLGDPCHKKVCSKCVETWERLSSNVVFCQKHYGSDSYKALSWEDKVELFRNRKPKKQEVSCPRCHKMILPIQLKKCWGRGCTLPTKVCYDCYGSWTLMGN